MPIRNNIASKSGFFELAVNPLFYFDEVGINGLSIYGYGHFGFGAFGAMAVTSYG